jgi:O-antigen/teichoic acid export membrane protein
MSASARFKALTGRRIVRDAGWLGLGQLGTVAARVIGLRLVTELVTPAVYAEIVLLTGLSTLAMNMFCVSLTSALLRFHPEARATNKVASLRALLGGILLRRTIAVSLLLGVGGSLYAALSETGVGVSFWLVAILLALDVKRVFESDLVNAERRQSTYAAWNLVNAWARPVFAVLAILWLGASSEAVLAGYVAAVAVSLWIFRGAGVRGDEPPEPPHGEWWRAMRRTVLAFAAPFVPLAVVGWIVTFAGRYILAGLASVEAAGIYSAAYGAASMPFILWGALLSSTLRPIYFDAVARRDRARERRTFWLWLALLLGPMSAGVACVWLFAEWIVWLLLGEAFWGGEDLLVWIAAAYAIQSTQQLFEHVIQAQGRTRRLLVMQGSAALTSLALYFALIPGMGATGAAIGTLCGMLASLLASILLSGVWSRTPPADRTPA